MKKRERHKKASIPMNVRLFGIRTRLIGAFLIPVLLIFLLGTISTRRASEAIVENYKQSTVTMVEKTGEYYGLLMQFTRTKLMEIASDNDIKSYYGGVYEGNNTKESDLHSAVRGKVNAALNSDGNLGLICIIPAYGKGAASPASLRTDLFEEYAASEEGAQLQAERDSVLISGYHRFLDEACGLDAEDYGISMSMAITDNKMQTAGFVVVDVKHSFFEEALTGMDLPEGSYSAFITPDGREIRPQGAPAEAAFYGTDSYQKALAAMTAGETTTYTELSGGYLNVYTMLEGTGAVVAISVPEGALSSQADDIKRLTAVFTAVSILLAIAIGIWIAMGFSSAISKMNHALEQASEGDLTVSVKIRRRDEFSLLNRYLEKMLSNIKALIRRAAGVSGSVSEAAGRIADSMGQLVKISGNITGAIKRMEDGLDEQAGEARSCLESMNGLEERIRTVQEGSEGIHENAGNTLECVREGKQAVENLECKMAETTEITRVITGDVSHLAENSARIGTIVESINSIAEQTNLLSLNASIEAARAGAAGRGFAVVAEEIKKLADASLQSSRQIEEIITGIQSTVAGTADSARAAEDIVAQQGEALKGTIAVFETITEQVEALSQSIDFIFTVVTEMGESREVTLSSITRISGVLNETALTASQLKEAAENQLKEARRLNSEAEHLGGEAKELQEAISIFKLD